MAKLEACLIELVALGELGYQLAEHLKPYIAGYDMPGLIACLEVVRVESEG